MRSNNNGLVWKEKNTGVDLVIREIRLSQRNNRVTDMSKTVKWPLSFANLGCKQGMPNPQRFKGVLPKVKRPPIEPPQDFNEKFPDAEYFHYSYRNKQAWTECSCGRRDGLTDYPCGRGYKDSELPCVGRAVWIDCSWERNKKTKELNYRGEGEANPTFQEFTDFFLKSEQEKILQFNTEPAKCPIRVFHDSCRGILLSPSIPALFCWDNVHKYFIIMWTNIRSIFSFVIRNNEDYTPIQETFEIVKSDAKLQNHPIPKQIYNAIFDFLLVSAKLYLRLRQCPCCGGYWILEANRRRGRVQMYCSEKCEDRFNQPSRHVSKETAKRNRKLHSEKARNEIISWLRKNHYIQQENETHRFVSREQAEEIYNNLPKRTQGSFKEFIRTWARPEGYESISKK